MDRSGVRNVLTVFVASPGDVAEERKLARKAADAANRTLRLFGWQIDLRGWEDTLPGYGRAQEKINADVRTCDLFIGLLHTRWGTPTGEFSSGFEEEYRLATELRRGGPGPEICLFFKRPPAAQLKDPGDQLKKVLDFRAGVEAAREVLFKEFRHVREWRQLFTELLIDHVVTVHIRPQDVSATRSSPPAALTRLESAELSTSATHTDSGLTAALTAAREQQLSPGELDPRQTARLYLFACTAMFRQTRDPMDVHAANFVYRFRQQILPSEPEELLLAATVVGSVAEVIPGWYWARDRDEDETRRLLGYLALSGDVAARVRATELLTAARVVPEAVVPDREHLLADLLADADGDAALAKIDYVSTVGRANDLSALERLKTDSRPRVASKASEAASIIAARTDPDRTLSEIVDGKRELHSATIAELFRHDSLLRSDTLVRACATLAGDSRLRAARTLDRRGGINPELARLLSAQKGEEERLIGFRNLLNQHAVEYDTLPHDIRRLPALAVHADAALAGLTVAALKSRLEYFSSEHVYGVLARHHFAEFSGTLRADLGNNFASMRNALLARAVADKLLPREVVDALEPSGELSQFIGGRYATVAIDALTKHGGPTDAHLVIKYLKNPLREAQLSAIHFLRKHGGAGSMQALLEATRSEWAIRMPAAAAAAAIAADGHALETLFANDEPEVVRAAIAAVDPRGMAPFESELCKLLHHASDNVRVAATAKLSASHTTDELETILQNYLENPTYFYNVVCWLDRYLYAPAPLNGLFRERLSREIPLVYGEWSAEAESEFGPG